MDILLRWPPGVLDFLIVQATVISGQRSLRNTMLFENLSIWVLKITEV